MAGARIGLLTSGGDCSGLNAAIRAVVIHASKHYGWEVLGIRDGTLGLIRRPVETIPLHLDCFDGRYLRMGGTMLGTTNKGDPFAFPMPDGRRQDVSQNFIEGYRQLGLDGLIVIGGDGSLRLLHHLCQEGGIPMIAIPKTIDNDVFDTEFSIGYATAVDTAVQALDRLEPTAASHHRAMILEVMGRDAGYIALGAGIAGGADVILIPEIRWSLDGMTRHLRSVMQEGRNHALVVVAEGVRTPSGQKATSVFANGQTRYGGIGHYVAEQLARSIEAETRVTVLGHVQRGGIPSMQDRLIASAFGVCAVDLAAAGKWGRMVAWDNQKVVDIPLEKVTKGPRSVDPEGTMVKTARGLGIYIGE